MNNYWTHIMPSQEIAAYHGLTARIDPAFATRERLFFEALTAAQCDSLAAGYWLTNESDRYQLARSYAAIKREA